MPRHSVDAFPSRHDRPDACQQGRPDRPRRHLQDHPPRYNELAPAFVEAGIDTIVCVAVNDPFVMEEWGKDQEAENVLLLPDGNGALTEAMGLMVDKSDLNFGKRSWRYSMLVRGSTIEKMFLEPQKPGDQFEVSDADTMLDFLAPGSKRPGQIAILTRAGCPFCANAKKMRDEAGFEYAASSAAAERLRT